METFVAPKPTALPRLHLTVIKWETHREVGYFTPAELTRKIEVAEMFGDGLRDMDCACDCWCIPDDPYDGYYD